MRFLADENCDSIVLEVLRSSGYDVKSVLEENRGATDQWVLECANRENRILITEDKDFGEWVYARFHRNCGVLLIRFPGSARSNLPGSVRDLLAERGGNLHGSFTVLEPGRARMRKSRKQESPPAGENE